MHSYRFLTFTKLHLKTSHFTFVTRLRRNAWNDSNRSVAAAAWPKQIVRFGMIGPTVAPQAALSAFGLMQRDLALRGTTASAGLRHAVLPGHAAR